MSFFVRQVVRYAVKKLASNPRVRETAVEAARAVGSEAKRIANEKDRARAAGRALRRAINKVKGDQ
ncbi:MAG: hypothetical protein IIB66_06520 [Proteobacteria bacterium]|nr:hypothetical protein [Pseudomonadota bacterium]